MKVSIKDLLKDDYPISKALNTHAATSAPTESSTMATTPLSVAAEARKLEYELVEERVKPYVVDMSKELPDIEPLISINDSCLCSRGNISAICGEAKSKKTFLTSALVASAMALPARIVDNFKSVGKNPFLNVLWVDTEQG